MSKWSNGIITEKGYDLQARLITGTRLQITRAVTGAGYVSPSLLSKQTAVTDPKQEMAIQTPEYPKTGQCCLPLELSNTGLTNGYNCRQIGIYAMDPLNGEILYCIVQSFSSSNHEQIPSEKESEGFALEFNVYFQFWPASVVDITISPANTVSRKEAQKLIVAYAEEMTSGKEAEGVTIVIDDSAEASFTGLKVYGKTTQDGTPTPDSPVDLVSAGDSGGISVTAAGKNLLPFPYETDTTTISGVTITVNADGTITLNGKATAGVWFPLKQNFKLPAGSYAIKVLPDDWDDSWGYAIWNGSGGYFNEFRTTFNAVTNCSISITIYNGATLNNVVLKPQIEVGTDYTEYEPYKGRTITIKTPNGLPGIPVTDASIATYTDGSGQQWICDEVDFERGVYVQRVNKLVLDGSSDEVIIKNNGTSLDADYLYYVDITGYNHNQEVCLCDKLIHNSTLAVSNKQSDARITTLNRPSHIMYLNVGYYLTENSEDAVRQFLAENPITIHYALETPVETPLTAEEMAAFYALQSHNPHTTITNDQGVYSKWKYLTPTSAVPATGGAVGGDMNMTRHRIRNLAEPEEDGDAATKKYVHDYFTGNVAALDTLDLSGLAGGTWKEILMDGSTFTHQNQYDANGNPVKIDNATIKWPEVL